MQVCVGPVNGVHYPIIVRRHHRARRYTLSVSPSSRQVLLTMPGRGTLEAARRFAEENTPWIIRQIESLPEVVAFTDGALVPLRGRYYRIEHVPGSRAMVRTAPPAQGKGDGESPRLCVAGAAPHVPRRITDYLKKQARDDLVKAVRRYEDALAVRASAVRVADQKSRWGSCSQTGRLSFSWRLVMAPPFVLDYLAAHEVSHLVVLDHSAAFWGTLERVCPDWHRARDWLREHGMQLHAYGG